MARSRASKKTEPTCPPTPLPKNRKRSVFDDPPRKNVFLLSCMDQRLLDDTVKFMNALNLENRYDQVAVAGGAMGAHHLLPPNPTWRQMFFDHLGAAIDVLHRPIHDVFLFEHLDCGAYKYLHPNCDTKAAYKCGTLEQMREIHLKELREFACIVVEFIEKKKAEAVAELEAIKQACERCKTPDEKKSQDDDDDECEEDKKDKTCYERTQDEAKKKIEAWSDIRVSYFVMDILGDVEQLDVPSERSRLSQC